MNWSLILSKIPWSKVANAAGFVITIVLLYIWTHEVKEHKQDANNVLNLAPVSDSLKNHIYNVTRKEFKIYFAKLDSSSRANGIKTRQLKEIITTEYHVYHKDTFALKEVVQDSVYSFDTLCTSFTLKRSKNGFKLINFRYFDNIQTNYFKQSAPVKWLFGLKIGKRQLFKRSFSKCSDSVKVERVIVD